MTRGHGMPPGRGPWIRAVAVLAVIAIVASLSYTALVAFEAPGWAFPTVLVLVVGVPLLALRRGSDQDT